MRSTTLLLGSCISLLGSANAQLTSTSKHSPSGTCFDGTGGPTGDFDWVVRSGEVFFFDTTSTIILGGPNGLPTMTQNAVNGLVDVRNLTIEEGAQVRVQGPNPMRILATGDVIVRGRLDLSGFHALSVATLNTGNQIEVGAAGGAGGGRGGNGNPVIIDSSPRGSGGQGPGNLLDAGGQGGETGYAPFGLGKDARRPGGGAGGRFARDQGPDLVAQNGADGSPLGTGAESGTSPARGGVTRPGAFVDGQARNDFFGEAPLFGPHGELLGLLRGELPSLWAGYGGGGGGNADPASVFPSPNWNFSRDEKGGAGGGGGGALHVQALGRIVFGLVGEIRSNGGSGAPGENTNFLDHIGGSGGSGSGGHVVLESATQIDFTDGGANVGALGRDWLSARGGPRITGHPSFVTPGARGYSNGGAGGPGVLQLHVPDPTLPPGTNPAKTDIVVPLNVAVARNPLDALASPGALALFLTCNPAPRANVGWFGAADREARRAFLRVALEGVPFAEPAEESPLALELDIMLDIMLDVEELLVPRRP